MADIKVEQTNIKVEDNDSILVTPTTNIPIEIDEANRVTVSPRSYHIVSPDIYTIKRNTELPQWFEDQLNNIIDTGDLADSVSDLDNQFNNFADGVTKEVGYLQDADGKLAYDMSVIKVSGDNNTAGIQHLNIVKVTADEASAISKSTIAAWQNDGSGGAWFDSQVSVVSNVAYSAAKSASTLTATMNSQQDQMNAIVGDINILESQVDGKVETWFSEDNPVNPDGTINPSVEPYASWVTDNDVARHTGDTYVWFEYDAVIPDKKNLLVTFRFAYDTDKSEYEWYVFEDDLASEAYQQALNAQATADGKINTFYQTYEPSIGPNPTLGEGDLWLDSDDDNKMYRYQGTPLSWTEVRDVSITASVTRLDEATVDVNGEARAKSSLTVDANGSIAGFVAESDGSTSAFKIYADKFTIANSVGSDRGNPFEIDTTTGQIGFTGNVTFAGTPVENALQSGESAADINSNVTTINGGKITTDTLDANRILANTVWVDGTVKSNDYKHPAYTGDMPTGFALASSKGNLGGWNIVGGRMYGGYIYGATLDAAVINTGTLNADVINSGSITSNTISSYSDSKSVTDISGPVTSGSTVLWTGYIQNGKGTGTLFVINSETTYDMGTSFTDYSRIELKRGSVLLFRRDYPSYATGGVVYVDLPYMDLPSDATYTLYHSYKLTWGEAFTPSSTVSGNISITQFKK